MRICCGIFYLISLLGSDLCAQSVVTKTDLLDPVTVERLFSDNNRMFLLDRKTMESIRLQQVECQKTQELLISCKADLNQPSLWTGQFFLISSLIFFGAGLTAGLIIGSR